MSSETSEWLNQNVLVGFTEKRGKAWHYKESAQGAEPNHYDGAIPVDDVLRRLFNFRAVSVPVEYTDAQGIRRAAKDRQLIIADDNGDDFGVFKSGYVAHQYDQWLIDNVAQLLNHDTGIGISSAALLQNRAQAFVQIELPENYETPEGFTFRPFLGACTSFNGTLATTYKKGATAWVCDNTLAWGLREEGEVFRLKHTSNSFSKIADARVALGILEQTADEFAQIVSRLADIDITLSEWDEILRTAIPVEEDASKRSITIAENKRESVNDLYWHDNRVAPWNGSALGAVQAFNTFDQHYKTVKGASRVERNFSNFLLGNTAQADSDVLQVVTDVRAKRTLVNA